MNEEREREHRTSQLEALWTELPDHLQSWLLWFLLELQTAPIAAHTNGVIIYANCALADVLGYPDRLDLIGTPVGAFSPPSYRWLARACITCQCPYCGFAQRRDGALVPVTVTGESVGLYGLRLVHFEPRVTIEGVAQPELAAGAERTPAAAVVVPAR